MNTEHSTCNEILQQICDDLAEDINSEVCQDIKNHLKHCHDCQTQLDTMREAVNLYRCMKEKQVPSSVHTRLVKLLNIESAQQ